MLESYASVKGHSNEYISACARIDKNRILIKSENKMKEKLVLGAVSLMVAFPVLASGPLVDTPQGRVPEPSTLGLIAAAAIAVTVIAKLKK